MTDRKTSGSRHFAKHVAQAPPIPIGISKLKAAVRQAERFLRRDNLRADQRNETERRLETLNSQLQEAEANRSPQDDAAANTLTKPPKQKQSTDVKQKAPIKVTNNGKGDAYKMLRHFEYVKTARRVKATNKAIKLAAIALEEETAAQGDIKKLQKRFHKHNKARQEELLQARTDAWYVETFPKDRKYISLYPQGELVAYTRYELPESIDATSEANVLEALPSNKHPDEVRAFWRTVCRARIESGLHTGEPVKVKTLKRKQISKIARTDSGDAPGGRQSSTRTRRTTLNPKASVSGTAEATVDDDDFFE